MVSAKEQKVKENKKNKETGFFLSADSAKLACQILVEPWITEKSHQLLESNKYIFRVSENSTKSQIGKSIESLYKVTVEGVNIVNIPSKKRIYGRKVGRKSGYKKAIITLKEGDKIELFEGV